MNHLFVPYILIRKKLGFGFYEADFTIFIPELAFMDQPIENLLTDFEEPEYKFVGFWPRFGALLIDGIILWAVSIPLSWLLTEWYNAFSLMLISFIPFLYYPILEYKFGATLGKMVVGIKIVNYEFQALSIGNVVLRNIIYLGTELISITLTLYYYYNTYDTNENFSSIADVFTFQFSPERILRIVVFCIYIIEVIFLLTDEKYRALHDRIGKTYVVRKTG